ncbi:MAG: hypothetical protein O2967_22965, partial [Proteobacteria bacterium]|nr:hypothetical protein [Pseudomonadota bacterium]
QSFQRQWQIVHGRLAFSEEASLSKRNRVYYADFDTDDSCPVVTPALPEAAHSNCGRGRVCHRSRFHTILGVYMDSNWPGMVPTVNMSLTICKPQLCFQFRNTEWPQDASAIPIRSIRPLFGRYPVNAQPKTE